MSENKYPIGGYALPANDAVQNWFEENIDKDCSASSAIYKFRLWLESLQPKPSGGYAPGNYNDQRHLIIATCEEIAHSRHGLDHAIDRIKKYAEEGLKAKPAGAVWVKGAPNELKQHFARVPSMIEDNVIYDVD